MRNCATRVGRTQMQSGGGVVPWGTRLSGWEVRPLPIAVRGVSEAELPYKIQHHPVKF